MYRKGGTQYFTPWHICEMMAKLTYAEETKKALNILDPSCGSGRMLLASAFELGNQHHYYGIDISATCVKMTAINLFLNGIFKGEVLCADALVTDDFVFSYTFSMTPFGIRRITEKDNSMLWHLHKNTFENKPQYIGKRIR